MTKLTEKYDYHYRSFTQIDFKNDKYGFNGTYTHKDLGIVTVNVTQDCREVYYLILSITINKNRYYRNFKCSGLPTYRLVGLKAKEFIEEMSLENIKKGDKK